MFINDKFIQVKTVYNYFNLDISKGTCVCYMFESEPFSAEDFEEDSARLDMMALNKVRINEDMNEIVNFLNKTYRFNFKKVVKSLPVSMQKIILTTRQELQALYEAEVNVWNKYCGRDDIFCIMYKEKPEHHLYKLVDSTIDLVMAMSVPNSPHGYLLFLHIPDVNILLQKHKKLDMKQ